MPTSCLVPGCKTGYNSYKGPKYRHVSLPKSPKLLEIWLSKIKRIDYSSSRGKICMKHFREDDLIPEHENLGCRGKPKKQRRLKPNAIPSLCLTEDNSDNCEPKPKKIRKSQKFQNLADLEEFSYETVDGITENPWDVSDPSVFLKYCCPECDYSEQNLGIFSDHALKNHVNSIILFKMKPSDFVKCEIIEENLTDETLYNDYEEVIIPQNSEDFKLESQDLVDIKEEVLEKYEDLEENISNIKLKELKSENVIEENEDFRLSTSLKPKHSEKYYIDRSRIAAFIINRVNIKNYDLGNSYKYFQNGFWFCDECNENKKFLFLFELFQHWRDNHDSDFIIEMNTDLEVKLQEMCQSNLDILSDCNELIPQRNYWKCEVCQNGVKFDHKFQLVSHWYENHSNKNVTYEACQLCMDLFTSPEHREKHHLIFHPAASSFEYRCYLHPLYYKGPKEKICTVSARIFYNLRALKNHYKKNHEKEFGREFELPFNCDSCDKSFILGEALLFHQKSEHGHQIKTLKCEYCPRTFFSKATKAIHENIHSKAQKIQTFTCKVCLDGVATSAKEIIEHHTDLHEGYALPFFECDICDFYSDQKKQTKDHLKSEHNIDEYKPYKCRQCNFKAFNYAELIRHIQGHTTELKFICEICNKALKTANTLRIHKKINHVEKVKENVCDICGYVGTKASLTRHMTEIHKKDKKCPYCEKNFGKKDALEYHLDNHHPGTSEIQHTCQECGKGFMFRNTLTRHFHYNHKGIVQTKQKGSSG